MADMIDRVAAVIDPSAFDGNAEGECDVCDSNLREARERARQVIAAMREPTEWMTEITGLVLSCDYGHEPEDARIVWRGMIDKALKE